MSKVLHLTMGFGGEFTVVKAVNKVLLKSNYISKILVFLKTDGEESLNVKKIGGEFIFSLKALRKLINSVKSADIIIYNSFYNYTSLWIILLIKVIYKKKLVLISHVNTFQFGSFFSEIYMNIRRYIVWNYSLIFADKFVFMTFNQKSCYLKFILNKKIFEKKSVLIPNLISSEMFENQVPKVYKGKERFLISFIGRFEKNKGYYDLLELGKLLPTNIKLRLIGGNIPSNIPQIEIAGEVPRSQIKDELNRADLFILPSYTEVFPTTIIESFARGVPILTTNINGLDEIVRDGINGYIFTPGDVQKMHRIITNCTNNPALLEQISINNIKESEKYSESVVGKKYIQLVESLND